MLFHLDNRCGRAIPLKTDKADEVFNVTENKTNSITDIFFLKYRLDLELIHLCSRKKISEKYAFG